MPELDEFHSAILEGYWKGYTCHEIAEMVGADSWTVACIMDSFRELGH